MEMVRQAKAQRNKRQGGDVRARDMKSFLILAACAGTALGSTSRCASPPQPQRLFNGRDLTGWHVDVPAADSSVTVRSPFVVRKGLLVSLGEPRGHLLTDSSYRDYRLEIEYRFAAAPGNAGVLVHASTPRALYGMFPRSIEVQMEHGNAGDFWCILEDIQVPDMERRRGPPSQWGTTEGKARRILNLTDDSEKPVGEWNTMVIEAVGRSIRVWVNGDLVNDGSNATADRGRIALQSEGAEVEFRKLSLTPIGRLTNTASVPLVTPRTVAAWVTTGDQSRLLARAPDLHFNSAAVDSSLPVIEVDYSREYQSVVGWGAAMTDAAAYLIQTKLSSAQREDLLQELFGREPGIGLSFVRIPMGASDFSRSHYSYDDRPAGETDSTLSHFSIGVDRAEKIPVLKRALAINPQLKLMGSPWSPPGWMKSSGSLIKGTLLPRFYGAFAEYFRRWIEAYEAEGLPIFAITLQNEPHFEPGNYPGMRLSPVQRASIIGVDVGPLFAKRRIRAQIWDWDHNWDEPASPLAVLADSVARQYVAAVAWHCYGGDISAQTVVHEKNPDKDTYFTECAGGEWAPVWADNLKWYVSKMVIGNARGWAKGVALWNLALDENHGPHLGGCANC